MDTVRYRSESVEGCFIRLANQSDDQQLTRLIAESMPSNGMILSFTRLPSYWKATQMQYEQLDLIVASLDSNPDEIIGMMNLGWRSCWINGQKQDLRYVGDLRFTKKSRGLNIVKLMMDYVGAHHSHDTIYQTIILKDNALARSIFHQEKKGYPKPFIYDDIQTFTISHVKKPQHFVEYTFKPLRHELVNEANHFVRQMAEYYNFLPSYDFHDLFEQKDYWCGLKAEDFYLVYDAQQQLCGIYGLWNQKEYKQTRVVKYQKLYKLIRPFYNLYAKLFKDIILPNEGDAFQYLMSHSMLCKPEDTQTFSALLYHAYTQLERKNQNAFCMTVESNDPRMEVLKRTKHHSIHAVMAFHSFDLNPLQVFDRNKISYIEAGRI